MESSSGKYLEQSSFSELNIPVALKESLQRHREHLAGLVLSLRAVGLSEVQVEESVSVIVASYKEELFLAMKGWHDERG